MNFDVQAIEFKLKITWASVLVIITLALVIPFWFYPTLRPNLIYTSATIGGVATLYSAIYIGLNLRIGLRRDKMHRAIEISKEINNIELSKLRTFIIEESKHSKVAPDDLFEKIQNNKEINEALSIVLYNLEHISIAIQKGYADEEVVYMSLVYVVSYFYENFIKYIEGIRKKYEKNSIYIEFEKLANAWRKKEYIYSKKPILLNY